MLMQRINHFQKPLENQKVRGLGCVEKRFEPVKIVLLKSACWRQEVDSGHSFGSEDEASDSEFHFVLKNHLYHAVPGPVDIQGPENSVLRNKELRSENVHYSCERSVKMYRRYLELDHTLALQGYTLTHTSILTN